MNWEDVKIFLEVSDAPSLRAAAKKLKVSHSKVSRRIDSLEADLGVKLFDRIPSGHKLTVAGQELLPVALQMDSSMHAFGRNVAGRDDALEGQVCVTIPDVFVSTLFMPLFLKFMTVHPAIYIKINDSYDVFDLSKREADVAIRFTNKPPEHLIGKRLGNLHQAVYATQDYVDDHKPESAGSTARWVAWGLPEEKPHWIDKTPYPHLRIMGHFNNLLIQYDVTKRGGGMGYFPCYLGDSDPTLVRLSEPKPSLDVWMLSHRDLRAAARMRAFRDYIIRHLPEIRAKLEGTPH